MKTAMRQLKEILENKSSCHEYGQNDYKDGLKMSLTTAITLIDVLLDKEKEQMIDFYNWMRRNDSSEEYFHYSDEDMLEQYLTKTNNL